MDKRASRFLSVFVCVLVLVGAVLPASAAPNGSSPRGSRDRRIEKTVPAKGRAVSVDTSASDIVVEPVDGDDVRFVVELEYWSSNESWMQAIEEEFDVEVRETGSEIAFRPSSMPESGRRGVLGKIFGSGEVFYSAQITLQVPRGTEISIDNRYGDVTVGAIGGPLKINNSSGVGESLEYPRLWRDREQLRRCRGHRCRGRSRGGGVERQDSHRAGEWRCGGVESVWRSHRRRRWRRPWHRELQQQAGRRAHRWQRPRSKVPTRMRR